MTTASKSNIQYLRDIIKELSVFDASKGEEANEFLDNIEGEIDEYKNDVAYHKEEVRKLETDIEEMEPEEVCEHSDFVGLDTIHWQTEKGNLKIEMQMEQFIEGLKKQNACVPV